MEQKTDRLYPTTPLEKDDLEQKVEKKLNDVNSYYYSNNDIKEMSTYFKDTNRKTKKKNKEYKKLTTKLKSFDTIVVIATTTSSITLSLTGIGLTAIPITTASAVRLSVGNKVLHETVMQ